MIRPNLNSGLRVFYVLAGVALLSGPFVLGVEGAGLWIMVAVGLLALLEGAIGW